jgi:hypothetical protein
MGREMEPVPHTQHSDVSNMVSTNMQAPRSDIRPLADTLTTWRSFTSRYNDPYKRRNLNTRIYRGDHVLLWII